jgi:transposase
MKKVYSENESEIKLTRFIGIDLGDKRSSYCELDAEGDIVDTGQIKMDATALRNRFSAGEPARIAIETGAQTHWVKNLLSELGHEVIVANARELRAITGSDRKSDKNDAEKLALYVRADPRILAPVNLRSMQMQQDLTLLRGRELLVRARTMLINSLRGTLKIMGLRLHDCSSAHRMGPAFH